MQTITPPPAAKGAPMTYAGGASARRLAAVLHDGLLLLAAHHLGHLGDLVDPRGRVRDAHLGQDRAALVDEEDVDARVHVEEDLREAARLLRVTALDVVGRRRVHREHARGEGLVGDVVVELLLEALLGAGDALVHLVDELPAQEPRQHQQREQHRDGRERHQRGELRPDGREADEHGPGRA